MYMHTHTYIYMHTHTYIYIYVLLLFKETDCVHYGEGPMLLRFGRGQAGAGFIAHQRWDITKSTFFEI